MLKETLKDILDSPQSCSRDPQTQKNHKPLLSEQGIILLKTNRQTKKDTEIIDFLSQEILKIWATGPHFSLENY